MYNSITIIDLVTYRYKKFIFLIFLKTTTFQNITVRIYITIYNLKTINVIPKTCNFKTKHLPIHHSYIHRDYNI